MDYRQIKAIEKANKEKWVKHFGHIPDESGIYMLTREEDGFKYAYVGQAKHILTRLAQHLSGWQHIDKSLKSHGLCSNDNPHGWSLFFVPYDEEDLDVQEQKYIRIYASEGYQLRNKTAGGQGQGKFEIAETKPRKTYQDGLKQGYSNARRDVKKLFEKNLTYDVKGNSNKLKERAKEKFKEFLSDG
jgi:hypothetical protein